jgi:hypothetical protein
MRPRNTDWTKFAIWVMGIIVGLVILGSLPELFEETGAADTVRGAGRSAGSAGRAAGGYAHDAGSNAGAVFENVVAFGIIAAIAGIALWVLIKVMRLFGGGRRGSARGGNNALRNAQREEYQSIAQARAEVQQQVAQARAEATRRRDQAVHSAQVQVDAEQDRWVS